MSLIEFVTIPEKSILHIQFSQVGKEGQLQPCGSLMAAEGFMGIKKI